MYCCLLYEYLRLAVKQQQKLNCKSDLQCYNIFDNMISMECARHTNPPASAMQWQAGKMRCATSMANCYPCSMGVQSAPATVADLFGPHPSGPNQWREFVLISKFVLLQGPGSRHHGPRATWIKRSCSSLRRPCSRHHSSIRWGLRASALRSRFYCADIALKGGTPPGTMAVKQSSELVCAGAWAKCVTC